MSLGGLLLKCRQKFGHGLRVAYWRDVVRPRILRTRPVGDTTNATCEIHVLTSKNDWLNLIWTLKSFFWASGKKYALCIHEDGSLQESELQSLRYHFPQARLIERRTADERSQRLLREFPRSHQFRSTNVLALKVFDFPAFLEGERMLLMDSDLLFFEEPTALLKALEDPNYRLNLFNPDFDSAYTVKPGPLREIPGIELKPRINSGLALVHRSSLRLDWIEEFLHLPTILAGHFWRIEQTLFALCSSRFGVELLPDEYQVQLGKGIGNSSFRHYVGVFRHLMYGEGIRELVKRGMLKDLA